MDKDHIQVYAPDNAIRNGHIKCLKSMYSNVKKSRWLIWQLFLRDLKAIYKQSLLGVFWTVITPFIALITFIILNNSGILSIGEINIPYPIFAILGLSFWQIFATGIIGSTNSMTSTGGMIKKINFSKEVLVFASMAQSLIAFLVQIVIVISLFIYYGYSPSIFIVLVPVLIIPMILFTLGLGFIFSLLNGIIRDLGNLIGSIITFIMFVTPVMYTKPKTGLLGLFTKFNPLYYLVDVPRHLILTGNFSERLGFFLSVCLSFFLFFTCWRIFYLTETRIAERI